LARELKLRTATVLNNTVQVILKEGVMGFLYMGIAVGSCYVLNILVAVFIGKRMEEPDELTRKNMMDNSKTIIYCAFGIGFIAIAYYWLDFVKWIILVFAGFSCLAKIGLTIFAFAPSMREDAREYLPRGVWGALLISNILALAAPATILLGCMSMNFGWF